MTGCHTNVFHGKKEGGYIADIPDMSCCSAFDETPEEAFAVRGSWIETAGASGKPLPKPRHLPAFHRGAP